jgi:hypothetical protein
MDKETIIGDIRTAIKELNSICPNPAAALIHLEAAIKDLKALYGL